MGQAETVTGMVLTSMSIGDYDKRITILTKERGKITAFARGAKRPNSQLLAATNPFCFGEFEVYEGKSAYTLTKATIRNYFRELTMDLEATYLGFYFLEIAEYYCQENNDEKEMLKLVYQSLRALGSPAYDKRLVRAVYEMKAVTISGEGPSVFSCIHCRRKEDLSIFSISRGGCFCSSCARPAGIVAQSTEARVADRQQVAASEARVADRQQVAASEARVPVSGVGISASALYALQYIVSSSIEKLYAFTLKEEVLQELAAITSEYMRYYARHEFKSLAVYLEMKM